MEWQRQEMNGKGKAERRTEREKQMRRFLKKNVFNIMLAILLIAVFGIAGTWELEGEIEEVDKQPIEVAYADSATGQYVPSVTELIIWSCKDYGIESEIPLAIARLETGNFTSKAFLEGNNVGGLSTNEIPHEYETIEEGVNAFVGNLARNYFEEGLDTVEEISQKYCPVNQKQWCETVKEIMEEWRK